jgi:hypothetical protein
MAIGKLSNGIKDASGAVAAASNRPRNDSPVWPYHNSSICTSRGLVIGAATNVILALTG